MSPGAVDRAAAFASVPVYDDEGPSYDAFEALIAENRALREQLATLTTNTQDDTGRKKHGSFFGTPKWAKRAGGAMQRSLSPVRLSRPRWRLLSGSINKRRISPERSAESRHSPESVPAPRAMSPTDRGAVDRAAAFASVSLLNRVRNAEHARLECRPLGPLEDLKRGARAEKAPLASASGKDQAQEEDDGATTAETETASKEAHTDSDEETEEGADENGEKPGRARELAMSFRLLLVLLISGLPLPRLPRWCSSRHFCSCLRRNAPPRATERKVLIGRRRNMDHVDDPHARYHDAAKHASDKFELCSNQAFRHFCFKVFNECDFDGSGVVGITQVHYMVLMLYEKLNKMGKGKLRSPPRRVIETMMNQVTVEKGSLNKEEFVLLASVLSKEVARRVVVEMVIMVAVAPILALQALRCFAAHPTWDPAAIFAALLPNSLGGFLTRRPLIMQFATTMLANFIANKILSKLVALNFDRVHRRHDDYVQARKETIEEIKQRRSSPRAVLLQNAKEKTI
jgi:hypothetical protein